MMEEGINQDRPSIKTVMEYQISIMHKKEVKIYMDDLPVTLDEALHRCVQEQTVYMPDYVLDDNGILEQVRFDRIDM